MVQVSTAELEQDVAVAGHYGKRLTSPTYSGKPIPALLPLLREGNRIVTPAGLAERHTGPKITKLGRQPAAAQGCFGRFPAPMSVVEARKGRRALVERAAMHGHVIENAPGAPPTPTKHSYLHKTMAPGGTAPVLSNSLQRAKPAVQPPPPIAGAAKKRTTGLPTAFRRHYDRGDLPVCVKHSKLALTLEWRIEPVRLDFHHFLPLFFEGIREPFDPHFSISVKGCEDLITANPEKAVAVIPQLILPLKQALDTREKKTVCSTLKLLQTFLHAHDAAAGAFLPYLRQLLQLFSMFIKWNRHLGDGIEYSQYRRENVADLAMETLHLLERKAGPSCFATIKYMVPTYESCLI